MYLPDMTWLAASGRLQSAIKYCVEVRKTGPTGNESNNQAPGPYLKQNFPDIGIFYYVRNLNACQVLL